MMLGNPVKSTENHLEIEEIYLMVVGYPVDDPNSSVCVLVRLD